MIVICLRSLCPTHNTCYYFAEVADNLRTSEAEVREEGEDTEKRRKSREMGKQDMNLSAAPLMGSNSRSQVAMEAEQNEVSESIACQSLRMTYT